MLDLVVAKFYTNSRNFIPKTLKGFAGQSFTMENDT